MWMLLTIAYEQQGAELSSTTEYETVRTRQHNVRLNPPDYGHAPEAELSASEIF